jgi:GTP-binding protein LepA
MVFSGIYPINTGRLRAPQVEPCQTSAERLRLRLPAETSVALGFGFRCGFLGLLHMEIVQERLRREYGMDIIATYPRGLSGPDDRRAGEGGRQPGLHARGDLHRGHRGAHGEGLRDHLPNEYIGDMMNLISEKRGAIDHTETLDTRRVMLTSRERR